MKMYSEGTFGKLNKRSRISLLLKSMFLKFTLAKTDTWASALIAIGNTMYRSGKRAGEMRKDNSNNAGEQPGSVDDNQRRCRSQDGGKVGWGRQIDDRDGKSKRVDCTTNIDIANSSPLPVAWLVEDDELTNESFKTSAKRKLGFQVLSSFEIGGEVIQRDWRMQRSEAAAVSIVLNKEGNGIPSIIAF